MRKRGFMTKRLFMCLAGLALVFSGYLIGKPRNVVYAQTHTKISKDYGKCAGVYTRGEFVVLVFEDSSGTIRLVNASDGSLVGEDRRN
jgi:hypothetical protein